MPVTDANRIARAHTPLGSKLVFREVTGREELSRLFEYRLELLAEDDAGVDPKALLGQGVTIEIETQGGGVRYLDAQCTRFAYIGTERTPMRSTRLYRYEARLHPWLWYATRTSTCRIFQNISVPEILRDVLSPYGALVFKLSKPHRTWEYCVQYQETDFNFVSRLMEHEGIYYYFQHSLGQHSLVLIDDIANHDVLPGYAYIPHIPAELMVVPDEEYIDKWQMAQQVEPGRYETNHYDYEKPSARLTVLNNKPLPFPHGSYEIYDWPGNYLEPFDGDNYASWRIEELQQPYEITTGESTVRGLTPGYLFTLERCQRRDQNRQYLIIGVTTYIRDNPYHSGVDGLAEHHFKIVAQPAAIAYRPPRITPKPHTTGPQTAVVVGPPGEEIYTDKYGRVKVLFHWDRRREQGDLDAKPYIEDASCWVRCSSSWAGSTWGQISLPRVGQEVIVDFINGDPDYPIIIGRVYNAEYMPPYALPRWKEYSTWKSRSTKHGGLTDWNEIRFYDYKGKEQVFIHAQWRMDVRVKWKKYETVKESSHFLMGACYSTAGGEYNIYSGGDLYTQTKGSQYSQQKGDWHTKAGGDSKHLVTAGQEENARAVIIEAAKSVVLKCAGSYVEVSPMGVTIQGPLVRINPGGSTAGTSAVKLGDALHASPADTGEPGYLDRPYRRGGGGSRWHTEEGYHSRDVTYNPGDGSFTYGGSGIKVEGTPDFCNKTLQTLGGLDSTPTGKKLIDNLQENGKNGKTVTIKEATQKEADDAGGGSARRTGSNPNNAFPAGVNGSDGSGTDTEIKYKPGYGANSPYTDNSTTPPTTYVDPDDETLLGHELIHADHNGKGQNLRNTPDPKDPTGNQEESQTIGINDHANDEVTENNLLKDLGKPFRRTDHDSSAKAAPK